ncbi:DUF4394 domain-containing protein [Perlucidibaca piscinae]|uniref:DUF4394 domain-containing protein n=1 Tax=Perlucidibaca piscinae TaxID=392589 RepID=UPI0003B368FA|nr:DUF4394 domain-containing protein [Perlucidibaca piscinae]
MTTRTLTLTALALGLTFAITGCNEDDRIEDLFEPGDTVALTVDNRLITFDRARADIIATDVPITGLASGETLIGIDYRTRNGLLYGLTRNAVYQLSLRGVASNRRALSTPLTGTDFGVDFNPVADLLRVISNGDTSQVVNVDTGSVSNSPTINETGTGTRNMNAAAYTNAFARPVSTTLYALDTFNDRLVVQNASTSTLSNPVSLGLDADSVSGFDIDGSNNIGYAALQVAGVTSLFRIDLTATTNAATRIAKLGSGSRPLKGLALMPRDAMAYGLVVGSNSLVVFDPASPAQILDTLSVSGLTSGEILVGIDFRPADGRLYGLTSQNRLYRLGTDTGSATLVSSLSGASLSGTRFSVDFNPAADRLRVISSTGQNLRINVDTGATTIDTPINRSDTPALPTPQLVAAAYTNSIRPAPASTTLYHVDRSENRLTRSPNPNAGQVAREGVLTDPALGTTPGFDIAGGANGLPLIMATTSGQGSRLFSVKLVTDAVSASGTLTAYPGTSNRVGGTSGPQLSDIAITFE